MVFSVVFIYFLKICQVLQMQNACIRQRFPGMIFHIYIIKIQNDLLHNIAFKSPWQLSKAMEIGSRFDSIAMKYHSARC